MTRFYRGDFGSALAFASVAPVEASTPAGCWLLLRVSDPGELSVSASFPMSPPGSGLSPYPVVFPTPLGEARGGFPPRFPDTSIIVPG